MNGLKSTNILRRQVAVIKKYGNEYKLTFHNAIREKGWEEVGKKRGQRHEEKLEQSISRSKARIMELALCNPWEYFFTGTLDPARYDREDIVKYKKDLGQFIRDQRKKYGAKIDYIIIPELHKDMKSWHVHGLLNGLTDEMVQDFDPVKVPIRMILAGYRNYPDYAKKFGFVSLASVKDKGAVSRYITKYVTKDSARNIRQLYHKMYYCSQGLARAETIKEGMLYKAPQEWDYENEYVKVKWLKPNEVHYYINNIN